MNLTKTFLPTLLKLPFCVLVSCLCVLWRKVVICNLKVNKLLYLVLPNMQLILCESSRDSKSLTDVPEEICLKKKVFILFFIRGAKPD